MENQQINSARLKIELLQNQVVHSVYYILKNRSLKICDFFTLNLWQLVVKFCDNVVIKLCNKFLEAKLDFIKYNECSLLFLKQRCSNNFLEIKSFAFKYYGVGKDRFTNNMSYCSRIFIIKRSLFSFFLFDYVYCGSNLCLW